MDGEVLRAVFINLGRGEDPPPAFAVSFAGIDVRSTSLATLGPGDVGMVAVARSPTELSVEDGSLTLPAKVVSEQDIALETVARVIAIDRQTSYFVRSTFPYLGISAEHLDVLADLEVAVPVTTGRPEPMVRSGVLTMDAAALQGRLSGVGYLAEALNASTAIGRYLQLLRLIESAFCLPIGRVHDLLADFLGGTRFNFTSDEVNRWLDARGRSAHADDPKRRYYLSRDVAPYVGRMLEAGYDVLLNKESWGTADAARREQWKPAYGSAGPGNETFGTRGQDWQTGFRISDMFEAFPVVVNAGWSRVLPRAAWIEGDVEGGRTRILGDWTG